MKNTIILLAACLFANLVQAQNFNSDYNPEMLIKYRKDFMKAVKGHNNGIKAIVNGVVPHKNHLKLHLTSLEKMFNEINSLFPEGSDFGDTNAKQLIWENPKKFQQTISDAKQALVTFKKEVEKGNETNTKTAFKEFSRSSCGGCHKSFKKKQN